MPHRDPAALRLCLGLLRLFASVVPRASRDDWRREWDAEVRHRWRVLEGRRALDWRAQMDLVRRALGALPDAAWLRRQFTADADVVHDVRHGSRMLRKSPAFAVSAVFILALGMGGTVSIASLVDTLLFRPLPYAEADRLVTVWQRHSARGHAREDVAPANFIDWRERARGFQSIAAVIPYSFDYTGGGEPEVFFGAQVTQGFWDALGMAPAVGRAFLPEEHLTGGRRAVIISHTLWERKFAADPSIVGRPLSLDGEPWTVVGVLPRAFAPQLMPRPGELSVWTPKIIREHERRTRGSAWWNVVARLKPGVTLEQAQAEMDSISAALAREYPRTNEGLSAALVPFRDHLTGGLKRPLLIMLGAVVLVLAIGCANVASLLLARGIQRERELAIRAALGAGRARMIRQLVTESLLLSILAAVCGVAAAHAGVRLIVSLAPGGVLRLQEAAVDGRMLFLAALLTTATALAFGLVPALQFSRTGRDLLRDRAGTGTRGLLRRGLVTAEIACALVLLTGAGLLVRSFVRLTSVDPGFSPRNVVAVQVFASERNGKPDRARTFFSNALERMRAIPGVEAAGAVSAMPFMMANIDIKSPVRVIGRDPGTEADGRVAYVTITTPGYFEAMSIPLREGRRLESSDAQQRTGVAVISDALRRRDWPTESPIGRRLRLQWEGRPLEVEVVGVVGEIRHDSLDSPARPEVFLPHAQVPFGSMTFVLRSAGEPAPLIAATKRAVWDVDPVQTFYDVATVEGLVDGSVVRQRFSMALMSGFAVLALVLCGTGIYGLVNITTVQRTREIGVRMALGADGHDIRRMVLRDGAILIGGGVLLGLLAAFAASRFLQTLLFEIRPADPLTFGVVCSLLAVVGLGACYLPARRATKVDPLVALRAEP
jgi:putative ABC transport system permease protein